MKKLDVPLEIVSDSLALSELSQKLGKLPSPSGSHSKGDCRGTRQFKSTAWKLFSTLPAVAPLEEHIKNVAGQFPPETLVQILPDGCRVYIAIGLFFDTWNSVVVIDEEALKIITAYKAQIELNCYPE